MLLYAFLCAWFLIKDRILERIMTSLAVYHPCEINNTVAKQLELPSKIGSYHKSTYTMSNGYKKCKNNFSDSQTPFRQDQQRLHTAI